jgi:DNA-binding PadR family transcriptional regulator
MHGQEIAQELEKRKGDKPSPGTIYPALKQMKENNWIKEKKEGKTITYSLTEEGKKIFEKSKIQFCKTFSDIF